MDLASVTLEDKYTFASGRIYLSGIQALVRLPMMQRQRDRARGAQHRRFHLRLSRLAARHATTTRCGRRERYLAAHDIHFQPGINEDLAATSVWGSQQVTLFPGAKVDGVFAHLVRQGPRRRPLDGRAEARQRRRHRAAWRRARARRRRSRLPVLDPAASERADLRRGDDPGASIRRRCRNISTSACWASRCRAFPAAGSASRRSPRRSRARPRSASIPSASRSCCRGFRAAAGRPQHPLARHAARAGAAAARAEDGGGRGLRARQRASTARSSIRRAPRLGIITTGKAYLDMRQALDDLGIDERARRGAGHPRSTRSGMPGRSRPRARGASPTGLQDVLVVEEKRGFIEDQLVRILYNMPADRRPQRRRQDATRAAAPLLPSEGEIGADHGGARGGRGRLRGSARDSPQLQQRLARLEALERLPSAPLAEDAAHAVLLLGLPAQHLDPRARGQPRAGRHRLPLHGASGCPARRTAT